MILVTGASGFLGQHICATLTEHGLSVLGTIHQTPGVYQHPSLTYVTLDLSDIEELQALIESHHVHTIVHTAAMVQISPAHKADLIDTNVSLTHAIVNIALETSCRLLHISSIAALGRVPDHEIITEDTEWEDTEHNSGYAISKHLADREVWRGQAEGLSTTILYPGIIVGDAPQSSISYRFIHQLNKKQIAYTIGSTLLVDVRDLAQAVCIAILHWTDHARYIIGAENITYKALFDMEADIHGYPPPSYLLSRRSLTWILRGMAILHRLGGPRPIINSDTAKSLLITSRYDTSRFVQAYPSFRYRPLRDTLTELKDL